MRCGHCGIIVKIPYQEGHILSWKKDDGHEIGYRVDAGFCPNCHNIVITLFKGLIEWVQDEYIPDDSKHPIFKEIIDEKIIYPSSEMWFNHDCYLPRDIQKEFKECILTLQTSKKASAALSRRLLQRILREKFDIQKRTLAQEIEEFIKQNNAPAYLINAIDAVRNVGNIATHPIKSENTGEIAEVEDWEAEWLIEILYFLIDLAYIKPSIYEEKIKKLNIKLNDLGKHPLKGLNS